MEKTILFSDLHMGYKGNSLVFNQDCLDFIDFVIETAKKENIKKCFFLGDYFHVRSSINVNTLNYAITGIRKLSDYFDEVIMLLGNHDLYYRESLEIHSLEFVKEFPNIQIIDKITTIGDCTFVPWLVDNEWKKVEKINTPYIFGHFEIPGFLLNAMVPMPETGHLDSNSFNSHVKYIFSGHFHKRQKQRYKSGYEIHYIGNSFPHNFSDANDLDRGVCIIKDDAEPRYVNWKETPNYLNIKLTELLDNPEDYINTKTYAKVTLDLNLTFDDAIFIREVFMKLFEAREIAFIHDKKEKEEYEDLTDITFESVDSIVIKALTTVESKTIDKRKLTEIYNSL
jgi:DNA repair exonuclease SbcCD nuclease subunit